ncbi:MAG: phosphomannomutase [Candidatus Omnitrophota bacterium]
MNRISSIPCFKAYDVRGVVPSELNPELAYKIGRAAAQYLSAKTFVIGRDIRASGEALSQALAKGLTEGGADVFDMGLCGTEMVYFAVAHQQMDGGIMITASHNPPEYNGMKIVRRESRPVGSETGLKEIERLCLAGVFAAPERIGQVKTFDCTDAYIQRLLGGVDIGQLKPMKIVVNAGNGGAGIILDQLEKHLPFEFVKIHHLPDPSFPHGVPNPLLPENRFNTSRAVKESHAELGIAWDGDFDRCFFFDENGEFIEGYYIVGFLAQALLAKRPGAKIVYDPRLVWNTIELVEEAGGVPLPCKSGHAFIKEMMRREDAVYGGEMSAHHYFKDFFYCDSGMTPWLLMAEILSQRGNPLSALIAERIERYPVSGEINRRVKEPDSIFERVRRYYESMNPIVDEIDGLSIAFETWRMNLRKSNTEPVIRLNVESRGDIRLMRSKTEEVLDLIGAG